MAKSNLFNLSGYAKAYAPAKGEQATGLIISGYRNSDEGDCKDYCNIWVPAEKITGKRKLPDGTYAITLVFSDVELKVKGEEEKAHRDAAAKKGTQGTAKKGTKTPLERLPDDDDIPF